MINTWAHDPAVRRRSYALLAEEFSLSAAPTAVGEAAPEVFERPVAEAPSQAALSGSWTATKRPIASADLDRRRPAESQKPRPQP